MLEKINDNAYKLELPADFGVSPTFNIADLKAFNIFPFQIAVNLRSIFSLFFICEVNIASNM